jgi:hypothetical protein
LNHVWYEPIENYVDVTDSYYPWIFVCAANDYFYYSVRTWKLYLFILALKHWCLLDAITGVIWHLANTIVLECLGRLKDSIIDTPAPLPEPCESHRLTQYPSEQIHPE